MGFFFVCLFLVSKVEKVLIHFHIGKKKKKKRIDLVVEISVI